MKLTWPGRYAASALEVRTPCRSSRRSGCRGTLEDRFAQLALVCQKPVVVELEPPLERRCGRPSQRMDASAVEQLARHPVRPRPVEDDASFEAHATPNLFGEFRDGDVVTGADIDMRNAGIVTQQVEAGIGEIVDVQELAARRAAAP